MIKFKTQIKSTNFTDKLINVKRHWLLNIAATIGAVLLRFVSTLTPLHDASAMKDMHAKQRHCIIHNILLANCADDMVARVVATMPFLTLTAQQAIISLIMIVILKNTMTSLHHALWLSVNRMDESITD